MHGLSHLLAKLAYPTAGKTHHEYLVDKNPPAMLWRICKCGSRDIGSTIYSANLFSRLPSLMTCEMVYACHAPCWADRFPFHEPCKHLSDQLNSRPQYAWIFQKRDDVQHEKQSMCRVALRPLLKVVLAMVIILTLTIDLIIIELWCTGLNTNRLRGNIR